MKKLLLIAVLMSAVVLNGCSERSALKKELKQALKVAGHMDDDHSGYVQYFEKLADVTVQSDDI